MAVDLHFWSLRNLLLPMEHRHRLQDVPSPTYPHWPAPVEDSLHFFTSCPRVPPLSGLATEADMTGGNPHPRHQFDGLAERPEASHLLLSPLISKSRLAWPVLVASIPPGSEELWGPCMCPRQYKDSYWGLLCPVSALAWLVQLQFLRPPMVLVWPPLHLHFHTLLRPHNTLPTLHFENLYADFCFCNI